MGLTYAEIELINAGDKEYVRRGDMDIDDVRRIRVNALVDSGAYLMAINENIQEVLQLPVVGKERQFLANGQVVEYDVVNQLEVRFGDYFTVCRAVLLPGGAEPLLGAIPMEDMNLVIDPRRQELTHISKPRMLVGLRPAS